MKTKEEILKDNYILGNNIVFSNKTPLKTAKKIIELIDSRERIVLDYGDINTNISWNECHDIVGRIGYSKGSYGLCYPILVYNSRCYGGGTILTDCILSIKSSKGKRLLFSN